MEKIIPLGDVGSLTISEKGGTATCKLTVSASGGGGTLASAAKGSVTAEIDVGVLQLADAGLAALSSAHPALSPLIDVLKAEMDKLLGGS